LQICSYAQNNIVEKGQNTTRVKSTKRFEGRHNQTVIIGLWSQLPGFRTKLPEFWTVALRAKAHIKNETHTNILSNIEKEEFLEERILQFQLQHTQCHCTDIHPCKHCSSRTLEGVFRPQGNDVLESQSVESARIKQPKTEHWSWNRNFLRNIDKPRPTHAAWHPSWVKESAKPFWKPETSQKMCYLREEYLYRDWIACVTHKLTVSHCCQVRDFSLKIMHLSSKNYFIILFHTKIVFPATISDSYCSQYKT
jgi:hypothetical protein